MREQFGSKNVKSLIQYKGGQAPNLVFLGKENWKLILCVFGSKDCVGNIFHTRQWFQWRRKHLNNLFWNKWFEKNSHIHWNRMPIASYFVTVNGERVKLDIAAKSNNGCDKDIKILDKKKVVEYEFEIDYQFQNKLWHVQNSHLN